MFRIRLSSGEEAVYRTVEELALGVQSGVVSPEAQIFHARTHQWLPIAAHPEYEQARARAEVLTATSDPGPPPLPALLEAAGGPTVPIYQMFSRSARELAERQRPRWVIPAVSTLVGLMFLAGVLFVLLPESPSTDEATRIAGPDRGPMSRHVAPIAAESIQAARYAPENLETRMARSVDSSRREFAGATRELDLNQLLSPDRLQDGLGVQTARYALAAFDSSLAAYRVGQRRLDSIYRDSARALQRGGAWSQADLQRWNQLVPRAEPAGAADRVDTLIANLDRIYALLLASQGAVRVTPTSIRFADPEAGTTYDGLRASLLRDASVRPPPGERLPEPLALLLEGLSAGELPPRVLR